MRQERAARSINARQAAERDVAFEAQRDRASVEQELAELSAACDDLVEGARLGWSASVWV